MGFFSKKTKEELVLVFDIGSSSVGACFFMMREDKAPEIIYSTRESIVVLEDLQVDHFLNSTLKALKIVVARMCSKAIGKPDRFFCVLSSPWYNSQIRIIKYSKETPFVFNSKLADSLIQKEVENLMQMFNENKEKDFNIESVEMKTMGVSLNGYEVLNPENKKATSLEISTFFSLVEKNFLNNIEDIIKQHFFVEKIKFSSFLISSFVMARDMFINYDKFLLVNIGGEITEMSLIKKSLIKDTMSFPVGCNFILRGLSQDLNVGTEEAKTYLSLYKNGHISSSFNIKLEDIILKYKNERLKSFQDSLNNLSTDISLPSVIFITVDQDLTSFFSEIIKGDQLNQYSLTDSKFKIIFLSTEALHGIVTFKDNNVKKDTLLIIESMYISRFLS